MYPILNGKAGEKMIEKLSAKIVNYLLDNKAINDTADDKEFYQYGIEITISSVLNVILILTIGLISGSLIESIVFLLCFIPFRQFSGGFHADSYLKCNTSFCICYILLIALYNLTSEILSTYIAVLISFVCVILIALKCPVENPNKPISDNKKKIHKIISTIFAVSYSTAALTLMSYSYKLGIIVLYTLLLITVLVIIAIFNEWRCKYEKR